MLSVIVYGRNDSHGYNLSRRVALSLNCLAAVLDGPDAEIVFVDYNTPDELPTFPEAIADTLTPETRRRLRVLRVRPCHHAPFAALTTRPVVEPVARNVGIRRADPANRWILSTNTDMILVPRGPGSPLGPGLADLPPALHHLPRFELPQTLWERLDRTRPDEAIAFLTDWGGPLHLRTALRMHDFLLYDAPGDFQLVPRADIERIHGFDEAMVLGWHVDSNLARRFALLRGAPRSLVDRLSGYHCEHTRLADPLHGHDHVEDDWRRFVDDVGTPDLPGQAEGWGLAGTELEEIRLPAGTAAGFARLVADVLGPEPAPADPVPADPVEDDALFRFDVRTYDPRTVLPFLADLLHCLDRGSALGYAGIAPGTLALVRRLWAAQGFRGPLRVHPLCASLSPDADDGRFLASDLFLVEVGALPDPDADATALADLHDAVRGIVGDEAARAEAGRPPRRVILLNAHRNRLSTFLDGAVVGTRGPSVSRLRQGFVRRPTPAPEILSPGFVMRHLRAVEGRRDAVAVTEAVRLLSDLHAVHAGGESVAPRLAGAASLAALCATAPVRARYGAAEADRMRDRIEAHRASARLAPMLALPVVDRPSPPTPAAPCRLAAPEDWEDPAFVARIRADIVDRFAENRLRRCRTVWEIAHAIELLAARGVLGPDARLLVVAGAGGALPDALSRHAGRVDVLQPPDATTGPATGIGGPIPRPDRIRRIGSLAGAAPDGGWDAICFTRGTLFAPGGDPATTAERLRLARAHVRPGGLVTLVAEVPVDRPAPTDRARAEVLSGSAFADLARVALGLGRLDCAPLEVGRVALDMCADEGPGPRPPHFVALADGRPWMSGAWAFEPAGPAPATADGFVQGVAALLARSVRDGSPAVA